MVRLVKHILLLLSLLSSSRCTEHRDLHVVSYPQLLVQNDWVPSQVFPPYGATAMIYDDNNGQRTEIMTDANRKIVELDHGLYDIVVFNGSLYNHSDVLGNICFRGTDNFETLEAFVTEMNPAKRFRAVAGDVIVDHPDIIATHSTAKCDIEARRKFEIKYRDGKIGSPTNPQYIKDTLPFTPCRVTIDCIVICRVKNVRSARIVQAKLRGFAGSVLLANRMPSQTNVTHQFTLNNRQFDDPDPTVGTIRSPLFSTFGPPLDLPERKYSVDIDILLINGEEWPQKSFDVTDQVEPFIEYLKQERNNNNPFITLPIELNLYMELPVVISDGMDVGVKDWGDDVIVTVPIKI